MRCLSIVRFPPPADLDRAQLRELLRKALPRYQVVPGLRRKYFVGNESTGGGVYEWESRAAAEAFYSQDWYERMLDVYGAQPEVELFDVHALVDNDAGRSEIAG